MPTSSSSDSLGQRIQTLRRKRKWNQEQLAASAGVTRMQIGRYERDIHEPRPDVLGRLAQALGTTTDFLITGQDPKSVRDVDLRSLGPKLERLPAELRSHLVGFLDALLQVHQLTQLRRKAGSEVAEKREPR